MSQPTYEVQLAIYDLSGGMARALSAQFLGPNHAIDIIPHTAIIVYGREYYFGMWIQSADPTEFRRSRQIFPIQIQNLGRTSVNQSDFERWCREVTSNGLYSPNSYDLLQRNCNNFAHDAATQGLRLPRGVPEWILDVPRRFLSSPMGQMIRPILEQMQVTGPASSGMNAPFADSGSSGFAAGSTTQNYHQSPPTAPTMTTPSLANNPWAHIPSTSTASKSSERNVPKETIKPNNNKLSTPVLDSHNRPLLSNNASNVHVCVTKLTKTTHIETKLESGTMEAVHKSMLQQLAHQLAKGTKPSPDLIEGACTALLPYLDGSNNCSGSDLTFALMILRLVVLHPPPVNLTTKTNDIENERSLLKCIQTVGRQLVDTSKNDDNGKSKQPSPYGTNAAARSMAWCTLSNVCGGATGAASSSVNSLITSFFSSSSSSSSTSYPTLEELIDAAIMDVSPTHQTRVEVRQSAAAFLYNVALFLTSDVSSPSLLGEEEKKEQQDDADGTLPDVYVTLVCGSLEGITDETDPTATLRRLLVAAKIIRSSSSLTDGTTTNDTSGDKLICNEAARNLVIDLGFGDVLTNLAQDGMNNGTMAAAAPDCRKVKELASEMNGLLSCQS